jgi:hypothetical protein
LQELERALNLLVPELLKLVQLLEQLVESEWVLQQLEQAKVFELVQQLPVWPQRVR